jgi:signal transduction histidine kinase
MTSPAPTESALLEIANHLGATVDLERLLEVVLERFTDLMKAERAAFVLYGTTGRPRGLLTHNLTWDGDLDQLPLSRTLLEQVISTRDILVVPDALEDQDLKERASVRLHELRMLVGLPIISGDDVVAVLYADGRDQAAANWMAMVPVLRALSKLVASALENARLFEALKFRNRLLAEMVHELRTPLTVTLMNIQVLLDEEATPPDIREVLEDVHSAASAQALTVDNALSLAKATMVASQPERVALGVILRAHVRRYKSLLESKGKSVEIAVDGDGPAVDTIAERMLVAFDNVFVNAMKYGRKGEPIVVRVRRRDDVGPADAEAGLDHSVSFFRTVTPLEPLPEGGFVQVTVQNKGERIPAELISRLFDPFTKGNLNASGFGSTGLGLSIAAQCVVNLGGRIWAESDAQHTRVHFTVPVETRR